MRRSLLFSAATLTLFGIGAQISAAKERNRSPEGIVWGSIRFTDRTTFAAWLSLHGISYRNWSSRHPLGVYLLTHPAPLPLVPVQPTAGVDTPSVHAAGNAYSSNPVSVAMVLLAALLVSLGAAGNLLLRTAIPLRLGVTDLSGLRAGAVAGGLMILVAAFVVHGF